jgi:hypothetical protein
MLGRECRLRLRIWGPRAVSLFLYRGTALEVAEKLMFCIRARLQSCRKRQKKMGFKPLPKLNELTTSAVKLGPKA